MPLRLRRMLLVLLQRLVLLDCPVGNVVHLPFLHTSRGGLLARVHAVRQRPATCWRAQSRRRWRHGRGRGLEWGRHLHGEHPARILGGRSDNVDGLTQWTVSAQSAMGNMALRRACLENKHCGGRVGTLGQLVRASFRSGRRTIRSDSVQRPALLLSKLRPSCRRRSQLLSVRHPLFWVSPCGALVFRSSRPSLAPVLREHAVTLHASFVASHVLYSLQQTLSHRKPHFKWGAFHRDTRLKFNLTLKWASVRPSQRFGWPWLACCS
jgi:hypothetical protein